MRSIRLLPLVGVAILAAAVCAWTAEKKKKKKKGQDELPNQTLELPKEPPFFTIADSSRLAFHVSALSGKGLLSQQVKDALKDLSRQWSGAAAVKLRAFVAGTGDTRRVPQIVSEVFTDKRLALPAVTVVQVGALPLEGAQVVMESVAVARKTVNPGGLAFISGQAVSADNPLEPAPPLARKSLDALQAAVRAVEAGEVLGVTCFLSSLEGLDTVRPWFRQAFPRAATTYVQIQRAPVRAIAECEAVARLERAPGEPLRFVNPPGLAASPNYSQAALVGPGRLVLTGTQMAFGYQDADLRLAFERLRKSLEEARAPMRNIAMSHFYPLTSGMADKVRAIRFEFYDKSRPPASTMLPFEGLPSLDASFGVDVVAVLP